MNDLITNLIDQLEAEIRSFYSVSTGEVNAVDHLLSFEQAVEMKKNLNPNTSAVIAQKSMVNEELFIGIYLSPDIMESLASHSPMQLLNNQNLNSYTVLVEELSHFHLIIHRSLNQNPISQLELEWQGEVDKLLFSAIRLREQCGEAHYLHLARKLYDEAKIISENTERYWDATRYAARLWYDLITYQDGIDDPGNSKTLRLILGELYELPWQAKLDKIVNAKRVA